MNLVDMTVKAFGRELAGTSPAPGGGSVRLWPGRWLLPWVPWWHG